MANYSNSTVAAMLTVGAGRGLVKLGRWLMEHWWASLIWMLFLLWAFRRDVMAPGGSWWWSIGVLALLGGLYVASIRYPRLRQLLPVLAEQEQKRLDSERDWGNYLLRQFGFVSPSDQQRFDTSFRDGVWRIDAPLASLTDPRDVEVMVSRRLALVEGAQDFEIEQTAPGGHYRITFLDQHRIDPRENIATLEGPILWSGNWSTVPYGIRADGTTAVHCVRECSGTVVGGLPGSGKTSGLTTLLGTLVPSPAVQFLVWDGKGGHDWSWLEPRAAHFNRDDEDRELVALEMEAVVQIMRDRLNRMVELRGGPSIWDTGGPSEDLPLLVLVVDECQAFLDKDAIPREDKEAHKFRQRTEAALALLVRKGRSVGIWVIPTTQKPTSDSLPTTIGSNAASAIAFRVKTPEAERAIMGRSAGADEPSATALPAKAGYAVVASEDGVREVVRFAHLPSAVAHRAAQQCSHLRRTVIGPVDRPVGGSEEAPDAEGDGRKRSSRRSQRKDAADAV